MQDMDIGILFLEDGFIQKIGDYYSVGIVILVRAQFL